MAKEIKTKNSGVKNKTKKKSNNTNKSNKPLNKQQLAFCRYYVELGNGTQAAIKAGYKETNARIQASQLLTRPYIREEISRIQAPILKKEKQEEERHIANAQEVMEFFTKMMNGEIKDQFGLDATNSDRIKAAQEIAKRTVDIDNRANGKADAVVQIALDWTRDEPNNN